jgi:UDP-N-acetylmuramoyl-tripeptide--D-alanyl-D-alanine ligase
LAQYTPFVHSFADYCQTLTVMTFSAPLHQLVDLLAATPINCTSERLNQTAQGISTDSRHLKPQDIFLALRGENFDGHQFVNNILSQGALVAITDQAVPGEVPQLVVADTLVAYQTLGRWWRDQFQIPIVAITGSVGKTTTKELIAAVLGQSGRVLKTEANYNNEIGVPKTLLQLGADHDFAVIEMGMRGLGEIACLSKIARPDVAVITNVGTAHIGRLGSREAIATAKCELLAEMPQTSLAILNAENPLLLSTAAQVWSGNTLTYGFQNGDLRGDYADDGQTLTVGDYQFPLPLQGEHNALNYLAALAVAKALNLDWQPLQQGITVDLPDGRAKRYRLEPDIILLDETYNAGPESMAAALRLLRQIPGQRHIAVLGAMRELGEFGLALHREIGVLAKDLNLDEVLVLGDEAEEQSLVAGAKPLGVQQFSQHQELIQYLRAMVKPGDRVLFKASHSVGLDQVVEALRS